MDSSSSANEAIVIVKEVVEEMFTAAFDQITEKTYKLQCVELYHTALMKALKDILDVYDMPKPRTDHSNIIEAWKRDKPAKPSKPDSLLKDFM